MFDLSLMQSPGLALIFSLISLAFSLRHNRFNAAFRLAEARMEMLGILSETASNHARSSSLYQRVSSKVKSLGLAEVTAMVEKGDAMMAEIDASAKRVYELTQEVEQRDMLEGYRRTLPEMRRLRDQSVRLHDLVQGIYDAYMARARLRSWAPL